jgi:hypothetical protein
MTLAYRIAGRMSPQDLTRVDTGSHFARCIGDVFARVRPRRIIETGTYLGTGTTMVIARALRDLALSEESTFYSIEVNPKHAERAATTLKKAGYRVEILNGLSLPRGLLPTPEQIERMYVNSVVADGLVVDHEESDRAKLYHRETDFPELPDDLLGKVLAEFEYRPDFVLLDSGGHVGHVEFRYVIDKLRGPCVIALDDIHHVKHFQSFRDMRADDRFDLIAASEEKFGFCVARFNP